MIYYLNTIGFIIEAYDLGFDENNKTYVTSWFYSEQECKQYKINEGYADENN